MFCQSFVFENFDSETGVFGIGAILNVPRMNNHFVEGLMMLIGTLQ
jgi:hypothetical protein